MSDSNNPNSNEKWFMHTLRMTVPVIIMMVVMSSHTLVSSSAAADEGATAATPTTSQITTPPEPQEVLLIPGPHPASVSFRPSTEIKPGKDTVEVADYGVWDPAPSGGGYGSGAPIPHERVVEAKGSPQA